MKLTHLSRGFLWMTLGLATVVSGTRAAKADSPAEPGDVPRSSLAPADHRIVKYLNSMSQLAVSAGQIAEKNGATKAVRDFGATLVSDHTTGNQELLAYAKKAGIDPKIMKTETPPREMATFLQTVDRLRTLTGPQFDREFTETVRDGYARTIGVVQNTQPQISDNNLNALLDRRLPILEKNYRTATSLAASSAGQRPPNTTSGGGDQRPTYNHTP